MSTRRGFLKKLGLTAGGAAAVAVVPIATEHPPPPADRCLDCDHTEDEHLEDFDRECSRKGCGCMGWNRGEWAQRVDKDERHLLDEG